jgi:O-antigen/teichoic acid export membrane protein
MSTEALASDAIICAPVSGWRRMLADTLVVGSSTLLCQALGAVTSLLLRMLLDPAAMGVWQGLKTFLSYANYTNLGISKGATQELAIARGRGDLAAAQHGLNLAHTINTLTSCLYAIVLVTAGFWIGLRAEGRWSAAWAAGLAVIGLLAIIQRHVTFQVTILRARQAFVATSRLQLLEATLTLVVSAVAIWLWGLWGLFAATLCVLLASLAFARATGAEPLHFAWDWPEMRRLISLGGPILLAGMASSLFRSLDKLMILGYLADREYQLGCYSLALMVGAQLYGLGNMISTVMGPRYCELLGRTGSVREVARLAARASQLQAALLILPAALAILVAPHVLGVLLPKYHEGLAPLIWLIPGVMAVAMALPCSQCLVAVGRGRCVLVVLLICCGLAAVGNHLVLSGGGGLTAVAQVMTAANIGYLAILAVLSLWTHLNLSERCRYSSLLAATLGGCLLLTARVDTEAVPAAGLSDMIVPAILLIGVWSGGMLLGWRYGGWSAAWRQGGPVQ